MKSEEDYDTRGLHADYDIEIYSLFARHRQCVCSSIIRQHKHSNKASKRPKQVYSCLEGVHFHFQLNSCSKNRGRSRNRDSKNRGRTVGKENVDYVVDLNHNLILLFTLCDE